MSFDRAAQIHPWLRGRALGKKYRVSWQFVVALVLIAVAIVFPFTVQATEKAPPTALPGTALYDQQGEAFEQNQLQGRLSVVNFFFTSCPEACPTQMRKLGALYRKLPAVYDKPVNFVSFSVDPTRDTQPVLSKYATKMQIDSGAWRLITGEPDALEKIRQEYGSIVQKVKNGSPNLDHSMVVYLQDAQARVVMTYVGADVDANRIQRDILTLQRLKRDNPLH